ncbi:ATP-binding protein [Cupriavidus basilensis]|uniref:histidine kinase n=1 Tax=Cupriavidus basilensis TaxID=68895 RepID=A0ABT6ARP7_9BURK|nr:ATP-binding protein [Cupriavidus basilensis]MDF3834927.1 ATP-binding protein [Cupriavidus basilensis]
MRIDRRFRLVAAFILATTVGLACYLLRLEWQTYAEARQSAPVLDLFRDVLVAAEKASAERGPSNAVLGSDVPIPAGRRESLDSARTDTDSAMHAAIAQLTVCAEAHCAASPQRLDDALAQLLAARDKLREARAIIDALARSPRGDRASHALRAALNTMFAVVADITQVSDAIMFDLIRAQPLTAEHVGTARLSAELREQAGRAGSVLTPALTAHRALSADEHRELWIVIGRIHALGQLIHGRTSRDDTPHSESLPATREMASSYFTEGIAYLETIASMPQRDGRHPSTSDFAERYVPTMRAILRVRDAEVSTASQLIQTQEISARQRLSVICVVVGVALLALTLIIVLFAIRVIRPLSLATDAIRRIAKGDHAVSLPSARRATQIGALLHSVQVLRHAAIAKGELEADRSLLITQLQEAAAQERAQGEALMQARDAAEAALLAKDRFLAMMSHEIRTPMHGMLGLLEMLLHSDLDSHQRHLAQVANSSGETLLQILNDILDYSKIGAGKMKLIETGADLRELIEDTVLLLSGNAHEKNLGLSICVESGIAARHLADAIRLRQILFNLISNAIKFTTQGNIAVTARQLMRRQGSETIEVVVSDTGIGIPSDALRILFEPFAQVDGHMTRRFGGTGLGLTICRQLAGLMGGEIGIVSTEGSGTSVTLRLALKIDIEHYAFPQLAGRTMEIAIDEPAATLALEHYARAAGLHPVAPASKDIEHAPPLRVLPATVANALRPGDILLASRKSEGDNAGTADVAGPVILYNNPIAWRAFVAACQHAMLRSHDDSGGRTPPAQSAGLAPLAARTTRVVVAEDHRVIQMLLKIQLRDLGYDNVVICEDGEAAWEALQAEPATLLVTDLYMPRLDGFALARRVRATENGKHMAIIAISASTLTEEENQSRAAGIDVFLSKPASVGDLKQAILRALALR